MTNSDFRHERQDDTQSPTSVRISAGQLLLVLRRHHIACSIDSLSAGGWTARLGEPGKSVYSQRGHFPTRDAAAEWLRGEAERRAADLLPRPAGVPHGRQATDASRARRDAPSR